MYGRIVCSKAGRDKGMFMVVVGCKEKALLVCDGKERPIERPKLKNIKHLAVTNSSLEEKQFATNRSLRRSLAIYRSEAQEL